MNILELIKENKSFPFLNANYNLNDYVLINLFWHNYILKHLDNVEDWQYLDPRYYNFDVFTEQSIDVLNIVNTSLSKAIIVNPIDNYLSKFMNDFFSISISLETKTIDDEEVTYEVLDIYADLRNPKKIGFIDYFLDLFLIKKINLSEMESIIEEFENTHSLTNV